MIQYFMKQYPFLLWGITSLIFSSLFLACSDDEPGDKTPVFTIKEEYLQQDFDQKQSSLVIPCLLYTSPSPRDATLSRMPSSA